MILTVFAWCNDFVNVCYLLTREARRQSVIFYTMNVRFVIFLTYTLSKYITGYNEIYLML